MKTNPKVDLNCDMGEGFGNYELNVNTEVLKIISSANIACGFHAGDPVVMAETVEKCKRYGVKIGAHPGLPDLWGFGRREIEVTPEEAKNYILYQLGALQAFCNSKNVRLQHVKLHGALYHMATNDEELSTALAYGLKNLPTSPNLLVFSGSKFAQIAKNMGINVIAEAFADRTYRADGTLVSRKENNAVLQNPEEIAGRAVRMIEDNQVSTVDGGEISLKVDSLCVHGDTPQAAAIVKAMAKAFKEENIQIAPHERLHG